MTDVFLYAGESNPSDVILRDPTTTSSKVDYVLTCNAGAYAYAGQAATLTVARSLSLAAGSYAYTGQSATLTVARNLSLAAGAYAYAGNAITLTYTPGVAKVDYTLACAPGEYALTGQDATLTYSETPAPAVVVVGGGGGGFNSGWDKQEWKRKKQREAAIEQTIEVTYRKLLGVEPDLVTVAEIKKEIRKTPDVARLDYTQELRLVEWLSAQINAVQQKHLDELDDEEALLLLI